MGESPTQDAGPISSYGHTIRFFFFFSVKMGSYPVAQSGYELSILLPQPPKYKDR